MSRDNSLSYLRNMDKISSTTILKTTGSEALASFDACGAEVWLPEQ